MKCIIVTILAFLPILSTTANAMDKPLAIMGSGQQQQMSAVDFESFSDLAIGKVNETISIGEDLHIQLQGTIKVAGNNPSVMPHLKAYLQHCLANYNPGMQFNAPVEIEISKTDEININQFLQFIINELIVKNQSHQDISSELKNFRDTDAAPFNNHNYKKNSLLLPMMYYKGASAEIKNRSNSYNNLQFVISPSSDDRSGKEMAVSFEKSSFPYTSLISLVSPSKNILSTTLYTTGGYVYAETNYKFNIFKLAEANSFRMQVELSSKDNQHETEIKPRKITNFHLLIK